MYEGVKSTLPDRCSAASPQAREEHFFIIIMRKTKLSMIVLCTAALLVAQRVPAAEKATAPASDKPVTKPSQPAADTVIAKGKGVEIKRGQLDEAVQTFKANSAAQGRTVPLDQTSMIETAVLDHLIQTQILISKATDAEKTKAKEEATQSLKDAKTNAPSEEMFNAQLKAMGTTEDQLVKTMAEQSTAEAVILRELKINITDADVKKFYDDTNNTAKFEQPEMVRASHILLTTKDPKTDQELPQAEKDAKRKKMEGLLKRAKAGEDFAKLAKEYSEDPGSKDKGGEYTFPKGQMMPEFESTAFALKPNEISDIITTPFGFHIIKLSEHIPAKKVAFDKVAPRIKNHLAQQEVAQLAPDFLAKLRKDADVKILDESLKPPETPADVPPTGRSALKGKSDSSSEPK
jgi:peptidyl-prolyl cis-trans isomerase C